MATSFLDVLPLISHVRRNHSLEHATMHVLAERFKGLSMTGISGVGGFYLLADLPSETICDAALDAHKRLQAGETSLAVHENCGTNLVAPAALAGLSIWIIMLGTGKDSKLKLRRLPYALILAIPIFLLSRPLGPILQRLLTTSMEIGTLQIGQINTQKYSGRSLHHIITHD
jgi:hypothetical protein